MLLHDVADGAHVPLRQRDCGGLPVPAPRLPIRSPPPQGRAEIAQPLPRKQIGRERYDHEVAGDERGAIHRAQTGAHVDQYGLRLTRSRAGLNDLPEGGGHPERPVQVRAAQTIGPFRGEGLFESRKRKIAGKDVQGRRGPAQRRFAYVTYLGERLDTPIDRLPAAMTAGLPQLLEQTLIEERRGQISLGIEIGGQYVESQLGQHPGEVVDQ